MYHLFLVHSHVTHRVALCAAESERLPEDRVAMLAFRQFAPSSSRFRLAPVSLPLERTSSSKVIAILEGRRQIRNVDRLIKELTGSQPFHLYTSQTLARLAQVLKSSRLCAGFSFLEEGLYSYCTRAEIEQTHPPMRYRLRERLAYGRRLGPSHFFERGHTKAYAITEATFPNLANRVVLDGVFPPEAASLEEGIDTLLAFDALAAYRRMKVESLVTAIRRLFDRLQAEGIRRIHYKLHPAQTGTSEAQILRAAMEQHPSAIEAIELPATVCLEALARHHPQLRCYVNLSSVGLYAALFGCRVFSFAPWVAEIEPKFSTYIDQAPQVFKDKVEFLRPDDDPKVPEEAPSAS